jgi:predicted N-acetyltransferase YhbS
MASALDIHPASLDELTDAHRNVFDIWSKGLGLEDHIRSRLDSPSHSRATWLVGCLGGRVVASLGSYPLRFRILGEELPGIAIGSVYTLAEFRGRGFAGQLLQWVENDQRERQAALSILYSDIAPDYYARRGYVLCPSLQGWRDPRDVSTAPATHPLSAFSPQEHLPAVMKLYADYHGAAALSIARDAEYWGAMLKKFPGDQFYALVEPGGGWAGYVRVGRKGDAWRITDFALADRSEDLAEQLYAALLALARWGGASRVGGWLPESPAAKKFFQLTPRRTEITMIKPLAWQGPLGDDLIAATSGFCEIDHV